MSPLFFSSLKHPKVNLEIGFGNGEHILQRAMLETGSLFIGCEVYLNGISQLLDGMLSNCIDNIQIFNGDAKELIAGSPNNLFSDIYVLFPDPWHKKKHNKRRLINKNFVNLLITKMKNSSRLLIATDCQKYYESIMGLGFDFQEGKPKDWINTKYERKAINKSKNIFYLSLYKKTDILLFD